MNETLKEIAVNREMEAAANLIKLGLGEVQNLTAANDFYFLPFQLLSQGMEKYMKIYICLAYKHIHGDYPNSKMIKKVGHDLGHLLSKILDDYFILHKAQVFKDDHDFLQNNEDFKEMLHALSEFGKYARYYNLDLITGAKTDPVDPQELWEAFENKAFDSEEDSFADLPVTEQIEAVCAFINRRTVILIEKFTAALTRQVYWGALGRLGKINSGLFSVFNILYGKEYGKTDYRRHTTTFQENIKKGHNRTAADEVIVELRDKYWSVVTIDEIDYGLNGVAGGRYGIPNVLDAGMVMPGISTGPVIDLANKLGDK